MKYRGYYLTSTNGKLSLSNDPNPEEATFNISSVSSAVEIKSGGAQKTKRFYAQGDTLNTDDIRVFLYLKNGKFVDIKDYTTDTSAIDMNKTGDQILKVSYSYAGKNYTDQIKITIVEPEYLGK